MVGTQLRGAQPLKFEFRISNIENKFESPKFRGKTAILLREVLEVLISEFVLVSDFRHSDFGFTPCRLCVPSVLSG